MADIIFSTGIEEYTVNGKAKLRVNFSDPELYHRFLTIKSDLEDMEKEFVGKTKGYDGKLNIKGFPIKDNGEINIEKLTEEQKNAIMDKAEQTLKIMHDIDRRIKEKLRDIFGTENDFDEIFDGVNLMAFDHNGNRIISNFIDAISPIIQKALKVADNEVNKLVGNREQRRMKNV